MSKKRRTRQQKIDAQTRHMPLVVSTSNGASFTVQAPQHHAQSVTTHAIAVPSHSYVAADIRHTLIITAILIAADLAIFFLLRTKIINIPGIGF